MSPQGGRRRIRPKASHVSSAQECRASPGEWKSVGLYPAGNSAEKIAWFIRTAGHAAYLPAGAFEAEIRLTEMEYEVWARFVDVPVT